MAAVPPLPKSFEEAARHHLTVEEELDRVCASTHFRSSKRSCEFLQYIVRVTLDGRTDSLKERSIGIDLFGRDTSYEPSSDATVRVRANEVRKRLSSYYASSDAMVEPDGIRIDLPTGSYVPRFLPGLPPARLVQPVAGQLSGTVTGPHSSVFSGQLSDPLVVSRTPTAWVVASGPSVPRIQGIILMRPALIALLVCTLLLRHQLENRGDYLRFWDSHLSGRSAMVLSVSPLDRVSLASSLYPLVWVAGRYGVDATIQSDSLTGTGPESLASVQVSYNSPPETASDGRLRWALVPLAESAKMGPGQDAASPGRLIDKKVSRDRGSSLALLTILPEDSSTIHVQGTEPEAIRRLIEEITVERNFPPGIVERLDARQPLQILLVRNASGEWTREISWGGV